MKERKDIFETIK